MTTIEKEEEEKLLRDNPHLKKYVEEIQKKMDRPVFYSKVPRDVKKEKYPNLIYPTKGVVFIHIYRTKDMDGIVYYSIEPVLNEVEKKKCDRIKELIYEKAHLKTNIKTQDDLRKAVREFIDDTTILDKKSGADYSTGKRILSKGGKIRVTPVEKMDIEYEIIKDIVGGGPLEPFMRDPYIEDIHIITGEKVHLIHKIFEMIRTNIFIDSKWASTFSQEFSEKIGSPVSEGQPIADGTLPDGSRVNIIHSKDVSIKGPSMTVRKFS
jgi:flagellar protein FlaI